MGESDTVLRTEYCVGAQGWELRKPVPLHFRRAMPGPGVHFR
jgi:hypothetical protein